MTQPTGDFNSPTEGPASPTDVFGRINQSITALLTMSAGTSRPDYVTDAGFGPWVKEVSSTRREAYLWDGTQDILQFSFNPTDGSIIPNLADLVGEQFQLSDGGILLPRVQTIDKAANFTVYATDVGKMYRATGDCTATLDAIANLGPGFYCRFICNTNELIISGGGADIDGAPTLTLGDGEGVWIIVNEAGDAFFTDFGGGASYAPGGLTQIGSTLTYAGGVTSIESPVFPETYSEIVVQMELMSPATVSGIPRCLLYQDSSPTPGYLTTASEYETTYFLSTAQYTNAAVGIFGTAPSQSIGHACNIEIRLKDYQAGLRTKYTAYIKNYTSPPTGGPQSRIMNEGWLPNNKDGTTKLKFDYGGTVQIDGYTLKAFGKR